MTDRIFSILDYFWPFTPLTTQKIWKNEKKKKKDRRFISLHKCTITSVPSYDIWFLRYEVRQTEFFVILGIFCPFILQTTKKIKILKTWKKPQEISFYTSVPKIMIICDMARDRCTVIVIFHFGLFFALLPLNGPKNQKFLKNEKNAWRYHYFTQVYQKSWSYAILFLRYGAWLL